MNKDTRTALWAELCCPHCGDEMHGLLVADNDENAALVLARDEEHLVEMLNQQLAETEEIDDFGVRRGGRRG